MGLYCRHVLPWLTDLSMRSPEAKRYRQRLVPEARGRVLEIGIGSGLNLPFYGPRIEHLYGLDPSPQLLQMAGRRAQLEGRDVELLPCSAEQIPLPDQCLDTVISTWTLCSIPDADRALHEMRRVLQPGGQLLFVEHGLAPDAGVRAWQHRLTPMWARVAGGCHLDRKVDELIAAAAFHLEELCTDYAKGPRVMTYMYSGRARPT